MNEKQIFIHQLKKKLANLPEKERKKSLAFYSEMIDDAMEDGMSEAEAVKSLGDVNDIARDILSEAPFSSIVKGETQKLKNKCKNSTNQILFPIKIMERLLMRNILTVFLD